ncbi:restriction endonuclease subunit S [Acinetobacter sp. F-1]|uniref:restriction endonuclease subunit S n=1 Tax=Acinetobacter sp. F-1 TaxID=1796981 RepID=UPI001FD238F1|nr:restriction endonuclease subunit S [Acinetobacter sp. F-1]
MTDVKQLITEHLDIWLTAETEKKSGRGRSSGAKDTIYGVQKLRELILDLAIRGKLVAQNPNGEPASELLKKISTEKEKLVKEGKIKKAKPLPILDETPFTIPSNWVWGYLQDLSSYIQRGKSPKYTEKSNRIVVSQKCVRWQGLDLSPARFIEPESLDKYEEIRFLQQDDILWNSTGTGTIGRACLFEINENFEKVVADSHVTVVRLLNDIAKFIYLVIRSPYIQKDLEDSASGTTNQIELNTSTVQQTKIPLPPLEEQQRIVVKVDELMQLCDQLEQQQTLSSDAHSTLVDTLLKALTESSDADDFQGNWQRIVANFDLLFNTEYSIEQLKQTVLQLAVMGKLVKQDPSDEPASELLKKIAYEKAKLIKEGKIKKSKPLPEITEDEKPFELPSGWEWSRLNNIVSILGDGLHGTPEYEDNTELYFINGNNLNDGVIEIKDHTKTVSKESFEKNKKDLCLRTMFVSINGTIGNVAFYNNEPVILGKSACYFNMIEPTSLLFIKLVFNSPYFFDYAEKSVTSTTIKNLSLASMNRFPIPLPPLNEQRLIVKKVNQLFSIIEQLQVLQSKLQKTKLYLADALVANAVENV